MTGSLAEATRCVPDISAEAALGGSGLGSEPLGVRGLSSWFLSGISCPLTISGSLGAPAGWYSLQFLLLPSALWFYAKKNCRVQPTVRR